ncbi:uncharacterized protein LOC121856548 [Homarus americanus]|uniref:uncharacterized protein LOC121856548 n=1 Tax=Homarus americanus TaxID=6706 RepID=UPI001C43710C|nr:uncharacterized protein LOC121856548 [Homarus americanus]
MESSGSYPDCEKTVQVTWSCLKDSGTIESHISGMAKITSENCLRSYGTGNICDQSEVQNVLSSSVKEKLAKKYVPPVNENCDVTQDSGDSSAVDVPLPSCSGSDPREQIKLINTEKCADIYKNLFRETHSTITKSCSKQGKGAFYTFSERSHSDLVLYLPKDLTLNTNNKVSNRRQCDVQKQKRKRKCHSDKDFSLNSCDSETGTVVNEELLSSETDDYFHHSQKNIKDDPETKVIQTRSGRKTRFTFFSKALNDNSDDDFFNESTPNSSENNTPEKRPKLNLPSSESLIPHRKRGRPRKKKQILFSVIRYWGMEVLSFIWIPLKI